VSQVTHPLALGELLEYWLGEAEEERAAAIEAHVFECDACAAALDDVVRLGRELVALMREGHVSARATVSLVNRLSRDRLNVRQYSVLPGEVVQCTVTPHDELLLTRLILPGPAPARIDVTERFYGGETRRVEDVAIDRRAGEVITFLPARPRQSDGSGRVEYVLLDPAAADRVIATYTLEHTAMSEA
jgi:hypothetical protein